MAIGNLHSNPSEEVRGNTIPTAPTGLRAEGGDRLVTLFWDETANDAVTGYKYRQRTLVGDYGEWTEMAGADGKAMEYVVAGLERGQTYVFRIRALAGAKPGEPSAEVVATISVPTPTPTPTPIPTPGTPLVIPTPEPAPTPTPTPGTPPVILVTERPTATPTPEPTPTAEPALPVVPEAAPETPEERGSGGLVAMLVGLVAILAIVVALLLLAVRRRRRADRDRQGRA